jgi:hypothetical protein
MKNTRHGVYNSLQWPAPFVAPVANMDASKAIPAPSLDRMMKHHPSLISRFTRSCGMPQGALLGDEENTNEPRSIQREASGADAECGYSNRTIVSIPETHGNKRYYTRKRSHSSISDSEVEDDPRGDAAISSPSHSLKQESIYKRLLRRFASDHKDTTKSPTKSGDSIRGE